MSSINISFSELFLGQVVLYKFTVTRKVFRGQKKFFQFFIERRYFAHRLWLEDLLWVFSTRRPVTVLLKPEVLPKISCSGKTFHRSSLFRKLFSGLLLSLNNFFSPYVFFYRSPIARRAVTLIFWLEVFIPLFNSQRTFTGLLLPEDLVQPENFFKVFYSPKTFTGVLQLKHSLHFFSFQKTFYKPSRARRPFKSLRFQEEYTL